MNVPGSANSVLAKVRAMYSDRLTAADYSAMFALQDTAQIAEYLKTKTCYSAVLSGFSASLPYVGQLHGLLRTKLFDQLAVLSRYEKSIGKSFYKYFIHHNDCLQLLHRLRTLGESVDEDYVAALSPSYNEHSYLDLFELARAKDADGVLSAVKGTEYEALLKNARNQLENADGLLLLEEEMHRFCCIKLAELIKKDSKGSGRAQLTETVSFCKDAETLLNIYRLKRLDITDSGIHRRFIFDGLTLLTKKQREAVASAQSHTEVTQALKGSAYEPMFSANNPEAASHRMTVEYCRKRFRFTQDSSEALWCYMTLREYEINDIMNIFEGVRCKVPAEYIKEYIYCVSL